MTHIDDKLLAEAAAAALRNEGYSLNDATTKLPIELENLVRYTSHFVPGFAIRFLTTEISDSDTTQGRINFRVLKEIALASVPDGKEGIRKAINTVCSALKRVEKTGDTYALSVATEKARRASLRATDEFTADAAFAASGWDSPTDVAIHAVYAAVESPALPHVRTREDGWRIVAEIILEEVSRVG